MISYIPDELLTGEKVYSKTINEAVNWLKKYKDFYFSGGSAENLWLMELKGSDMLDSIKKLTDGSRWGFMGGTWKSPDSRQQQQNGIMGDSD